MVLLNYLVNPSNQCHLSLISLRGCVSPIFSAVGSDFTPHRSTRTVSTKAWRNDKEVNRVRMAVFFKLQALPLRGKGWPCLLHPELPYSLPQYFKVFTMPVTAKIVLVFIQLPVSSFNKSLLDTFYVLSIMLSVMYVVYNFKERDFKVF